MADPSSFARGVSSTSSKLSLTAVIGSMTNKFVDQVEDVYVFRSYHNLPISLMLVIHHESRFVIHAINTAIAGT